MCDSHGKIPGYCGCARVDVLVFFLFMASVSGCHSVTSPYQPLIGRVNSETLWRSACGAFWDPQTILPLTGAILFSLDDFDERGAQWATKHRPLFKTRERANRASDDHLAVLVGEAMVTALVRPADATEEAWSRQKARHLAAEGFAVGTTYAAIQGLKEGIGRTGPDGWKDTAMPSGHSSGAFLFSTLSNRNLDALCQNRSLRVPLQVSNIALAASVGWARVEGGHHFPSDVLAGAALGHFMAAFMHDVFLGHPSESTVALAFNPSTEGGAVTVGIRF